MRLRYLALILTCTPAWAAGGTCPAGADYGFQVPTGSRYDKTLATVGVTSCYYVSASTGSDTYDGTQETVSGSHGPFAHLPGMPSCTGNCASVTPAAGEGFILRGGDTWTGSDLGVSWSWSGTPTNPIYIGVDLTWHAGASWTRPI